MRIQREHMQKVTNALFSLKEATASFAPQSFATKCFLIFIVDEVKNFAANIIFKLVCQSRTRSYASLVRHVLGSVQKGWHSYIKEFRGSETVEGFYCKFIYGDCRVQGQNFCTRSETSLYYNGLLFRKVSPQVFYCETSLVHWFSQVIISYLIYFFPLHYFDMILMFVCFHKIYS